MNQSKNATYIKRQLEYHIFKNKSIFLCQEDRQEAIALLKIIDIQNDFFVTEIIKQYFDLELNGSKPPEQNHFSVKLASLDSSIVFSTRFYSLGANDAGFVKKKNTLLLANPIRCEVSNLRREIRFSLENPALRLSCKIHSIFAPDNPGSFEISSERLIDISPTAVSFLLPRESGIGLPQDPVSDLTLYKDEKKVLQISGSVFRINKNKYIDSEQGRGYVCVVRFEPISQKISRFSQNIREVRAKDFDIDIYVEAQHPVLGDHILLGRIDVLSKIEFSVELKDTEAPMIPGLFFQNFKVQLPFGEKVTTTARLVSFEPLENEVGEYKYSARFWFMDKNDLLLKFINILFQSNVDKRLRPLNEEKLERLWAFFFESGFIYSEKRRQLKPYTQTIRSTYKKISKTDTTIFRTVLFQKRHQILGHSASVLFFDNSWLVQHTASINQAGENIVGLIMRGIIEDFVDDPESRLTNGKYMFGHYRPNNLFVAVLFEEPAFAINDPNLSGIQEFDFCLKKGEPVHIKAEKEVRVSEAKEEGLFELESLLVGKKDYLTIQLEGLSAEKICNLGVTREFEKTGLYRYRKVFVAASEKTGNQAFAVCNYCSPGISLSELTNSFRIYFSGHNAQENQRLATQVCGEVIPSYQRTEMEYPILLADKAQPIPLQFAQVKSYNRVFYKLEKAPFFQDGVDNAIKNMKYHIKKRRNIKCDQPA